MGNQTTDEFMIRMGWDASAVARGTQAMIMQQQSVADKVTAIWKKQAADRVMMDKEASAKIEENARLFDVAAATRRNQARALLRGRAASAAEGKAALDAEVYAASKAGAIGPGWVAGQTASGLEQGVVGGAGGYGLIRLGSAVWRFTKALATGQNPLEGLSAEWPHMFRAFKLASNGLARFGLIMTGLAEAAGIVYYSMSMKRATEGEIASGVAEQKTMGGLAGRLGKIISDLQKSGKLSPDLAAKYNQILQNPSFENISLIQRRLNPLMPKAGDPTSSEYQSPAELDYSKKMGEILESRMSINARVEMHQDRVNDLMEKQNALDEKSVDYVEQRAALGLQILAETDQVNKALADGNKLDNEALDIAGRIMAEKAKIAGNEREYPTLGDLAGRGFKSDLDALYGKGGQFDLGAGNGPYAAIAQEYLLAQKQQIWDRTYGNMGAANADQKRMISARKQLGDLGVESPAMDMAMMRADIATMVKQLDLLKAQGATESNPIFTQAKITE